MTSFFLHALLRGHETRFRFVSSSSRLGLSPHALPAIRKQQTVLKHTQTTFNAGLHSIPQGRSPRRRRRRQEAQEEQQHTGTIREITRKDQSELLQALHQAESDRRPARNFSSKRRSVSPSVTSSQTSTGHHRTARQPKEPSKQPSPLESEQKLNRRSVSSPFAFTSTSSMKSISIPESSPLMEMLGEDPSSLFDVFRVKQTKGSDDAPSKLVTSATYDTTAFQQYTELLHQTIERTGTRLTRHHTSKPIPKRYSEQVLSWLRSGEPQVSQHLPSLQKALDEGLSPMQQNASESEQLFKDRHEDSFRAEVEEQHNQFRDALGWNESQVTMAKNSLFVMANTCAKKAMGLPVQVIWDKVKEAGILTDQKLLQVLLYVSANSSAGMIRKNAAYGRLLGTNSILDILNKVSNDFGASTSDSEPSNAKQVVEYLDEIALCHDFFYEPTEQTINIRIRLLISQGKTVQADELLHAYAQKAELRLRTYTPVLLQYLDQGHVSSALRLFKRMQELPLVHLDAASYINLLSGLALQGVFHPEAPPLDSAKELGYSASSGPELFDEIITMMSRDILEIPLALAKRLYNAFAEGFPDSGFDVSGSFAPLKLTSQMAERNELVVSRVLIDPDAGKCPRSGVTLRLIHLTPDEKLKLKETILSLAKSTAIEFAKTQNTSSKSTADKDLLKFFQWLDNRRGEPFTAVVDAANVAYYLQNFEDGRFSYHQIKFVVDALESMGEHPLVVLPTKYVLPYFNVTIGAGSSSGPKKQTLTKEEEEIKNSLMKSGKLYVVPPGCLDDYFWILASVSEQSASRRGRDLNVAPGSAKGRWPGTRPVLISNDQMRDHRLEMLEPKLFRRWYSNFIVNYNFSGFFGAACTNPEIGFSPADFFSREIQGNRDPSSNATVWHFPLADCPDEWLCLRIPRK